jgi:anti-sigma factor RsiW
VNNDEAKLILSAYRPGGEDANDARFAEALAQAGRDPELAAWFKEQRRFDSAISDALEAVPPPGDLRAKILAGGRVSRSQVWSTPRRILALAAGIVLLAALAGIWFNRSAGLDRWQRDALAIIPMFGTGAEHFDLENKDPSVLQQWLQTQNAPAPDAMPVALQTLPALGCKTIRSGGHAVSIICFQMRTGEFIHLVVTEQGTLSRPPPSAPRFVQEDGWRTASWSAHGRAYMLATKASERELREVMAITAQASRVKSRRIASESDPTGGRRFPELVSRHRIFRAAARLEML